MIDQPNFQKSIHPIQTVYLDTSYQEGSEEIVVFQKGFSLFKLYEKDPINNQYLNKQVLAGKVLGDTLKMTSTHSIFISNIPGISEVRYPNEIKLNTSWIIFNQIQATVSSLSVQDIPGYGLDSVAKIKCNGINDTILLSKNNGLIKTIDFTDSPKISIYHKIDWKGEVLYKGEFYNVFPGDKYVIQNYSFNGATIVSTQSTADITNTYEFLTINEINDSLNILVKRTENGYLTTTSTVNIDTTYNESWRIPKNDSVSLKKSGLAVKYYLFRNSPFYVYNFLLYGWSDNELRDPIYQIEVANLNYDSTDGVYLEYQPMPNTTFSGSMVNIGLNVEEYFSDRATRFDIHNRFGKLISATGSGIGQGGSGGPCNLSNFYIISGKNVLVCNLDSASYQWYDCDNNQAITNDTNKSFYYNQTGNYKVIVDYYGCTDTSDCINAIYCSLPDTLISVDSGQYKCLLDSASYQWFLCSNGRQSMNGETNQIFIPTQSGSYQVRVRKDGCEEFSECVSFVGLNESQKLAAINIYPSPTSNFLNIRSKIILREIEIRNINGQLVLEKNFSKQVDVSDLPPGVYFIKLIGDETVIQKFIKE